MESRFERITESPDALAAVLASIPTADAPWDIAFERAFCAGCAWKLRWLPTQKPGSDSGGWSSRRRKPFDQEG